VYLQFCLFAGLVASQVYVDLFAGTSELSDGVFVMVLHSLVQRMMLLLRIANIASPSRKP
jgi:hypothetical protein